MNIVGHFARNRLAAAAALIWLCCAGVESQAGTPLRFDCGTADSPVMKGYQRLTADDTYAPSRGYGWLVSKPESLEFQNPGPLRSHTRPREEVFQNNLTDLNRDAVVSNESLTFRANVPNGTYRVVVTIGNMARAIGSIDVLVNGEAAGNHVAAWTPGGYRGFKRDPYGWWAHVGHTVEVSDGIIRIVLEKNQSYFEEEMAKQRDWENPFRQWWPRAPKKAPPYYFIGFPFTQSSIMAIEILPYVPAPVVAGAQGLELTADVGSPTLDMAVAEYNKGNFTGSVAALMRATERSAQAARATLALRLAGRLEVEEEAELISKALPILRQYVAARPDQTDLVEFIRDAEYFEKALKIHTMRGELGKNHFIENDKAIGWWWLIREDSPLYYKSQLYIARAIHMLRPYMPNLGTEAEILKELEKKFPDNRHVKYLLHWEWEPYGDGTDPKDWYMKDYESKVKDSPEWVRGLYPAFMSFVDWGEWFIRNKQQPEGTIGGGWGDDVEIVAAFGYMGLVSRGLSHLCIEGTTNLVNGVWNLSEVDPELGFCLPLADAEHTAEWTGNTLGMMVIVDYGNPLWIERSMKTGKLLRDLWTGIDKNGHRHFRSNLFGAAGVGRGDSRNDSCINYRAIAPASAVLWYNQNPTIERLYIELADAWLDAAMSTDRGKPEGIIPVEISFPDGVIGGTNSPNWYTASHTKGTVNYDWAGQKYKYFIQNLLMTAYERTGDQKYLRPLELEQQLAARYRATRRGLTEKRELEPGSEEWIAARLQYIDAWQKAERLVKGRQGGLENTVERDEISSMCKEVYEQLRLRWPLMTTEASATDRALFPGWMKPLVLYSGGSWSGRFMLAAVTYESTTRDFAAAVTAHDPQGLRLVYHSLAPAEREIGLVPWELEPGGTYVLRYGPDADEDETMDEVIEERTLVLAQRGTPVHIKVAPRITYIVEIDQVKRGRGVDAAPDPGLSSDDIRYVESRNMILARIHNVGAKSVQNVKVAFYDGDPNAGGKFIGETLVPNIEAPNDLEPRTVTVGVNYLLEGRAREIYVVVDPDDEISDEITTYNNMAHAKLPKKSAKPAPVKKIPTTSFRRGRR